MGEPVLIVRLHSLGDVVLASATASAVSEGCPVIFATAPVYIPIAERFPGDITPVPVHGIRELRRASRRCARVIDLQNNLTTRLAFSGSGVSRFSFDRSLRRRILSGSGETMEWRASQYMKTAGPDRDPFPVLKRSNASGSGGLNVGIVAGGRWPMKAIPSGVAAELARLFCDEQGASVFILGSASDRDEAAAIQAECGYRDVISVAGEGGIPELLRRIETLDLLVSPDSGPAHMAMALGVPVQVVFTATSPSLGFYPSDFKGTFCKDGLQCRPCHRHGGTKCMAGDEGCRKMLLPVEIYRESLCLMR